MADDALLRRVLNATAIYVVWYYDTLNDMKVSSKAVWGLCLAMAGFSGCMTAYKKSVGGDTVQLQYKIFLAEYAFAWEAAVEALKASPMDVVNRENGTLQTKWIDNTAERNLIDSAGSVSPYVKAQYRFRVTLSKGYYEGHPSVRIGVQKEQQFQRDVLEGWRNQESDGIQENSLLYRIGKLIEFKNRAQHLENESLRKQMNDAAGSDFNSVPPATTN